MKKDTKKPGRPVSVDGKRINVYLTEKQIKKAAEIGNGNVSAGVREAIDKNEEIELLRGLHYSCRGWLRYNGVDAKLSREYFDKVKEYVHKINDLNDNGGSCSESESNDLLCCPLCGGNAVWCGDHDVNDLHDCHFILCVGECGTQFDTLADDNAAETQDEMRAIAAMKFNKRAI